MEVDREVSWYRGTKDTELFFSHSGTAYLFEPNLGFFSARSKHFHFEFSNEGNVENDLRSDLQSYGMSWSHRIFTTEKNIYLIGAGTLFLPYSLVS
jgi:hypothetical protein